MTTDQGMTEVEKVYLRAADLIAERGWTQGDYEALDGRLCMMGACQVAVIEDGYLLSDGLYTAVFQGLEQHLGRNPIAWNDVHGRTKTQVIRALLKAAGKEA
jgi:hypothetical protein